jgi:hypothetical protein
MLKLTGMVTRLIAIVTRAYDYVRCVVVLLAKLVMKVLNENSKSQFSRSVSPAMIRRKSANEKKVAELIDLAKEKQFDLVKVKVIEKIKEYSPILK